MRLIFFFTIFASCLWIQDAFAQQVYKHVDADGRVHYSSKPPHAGAEPAKLPQLTRLKESETVELLQTCDQHGGINCQAGADADGSVICFDGFTDASARFNFSCSTARLKVADVKIAESGALKVMVRNTRSVVAENPNVKISVGSNIEVTLMGPDKIEAYGVGEFSFDDLENQLVGVNVTRQNVQITCSNCD